MSPAKTTKKPEKKAAPATKAAAKTAPAKAVRTKAKTAITEDFAGGGSAAASPMVAARSQQEPIMMPRAEGKPGQEGRYVYGIIEGSDAVTFGKTGVGGANETVYTVHHGDVAAVVSKTSVFIFDPTRE